VDKEDKKEEDEQEDKKSKKLFFFPLELSESGKPNSMTAAAAEE